jgi:hypothetical protein
MPDQSVSRLQSFHREPRECLASIGWRVRSGWSVTGVEETSTGAWVIRYTRPRPGALCAAGTPTSADAQDQFGRE